VCCTKLSKRQQHYATSTNFARKIRPFSNLSQQHQHPTRRNTSQHLAIAPGSPNARNIVRLRMLRSFGRGLIIITSLIFQQFRKQSSTTQVPFTDSCLVLLGLKPDDYMICYNIAVSQGLDTGENKQRTQKKHNKQVSHGVLNLTFRVLQHTSSEVMVIWQDLKSPRL